MAKTVERATPERCTAAMLKVDIGRGSGETGGNSVVIQTSRAYFSDCIARSVVRLVQSSMH